MITVKIFFSYLCCLTIAIYSTSFTASALSEMESTRIQGTSGAGVASMLINETTLLNPSTIAFFENSTFYYQKGQSTLEDNNSLRSSSFSDGHHEIISIADTSSPVNGGFAYEYQNNFDGKRTRYSTSLSSVISKSSSFGLIYRYSIEDSPIIDDSFHQLVLGYTKIYSEKLTLALVVVDPFQTIKEYFNYTAGFQYNLNEFFALIVDLGSGDVQNPDKNSFTKWALQLQSFKQFYIRYGQFHDIYKNLRGSSYGLSWVGPKFSIDYANKTSEIISSSTDMLLSDEKFVENSFGITVLF